MLLPNQSQGNLHWQFRNTLGKPLLFHPFAIDIINGDNLIIVLNGCVFEDTIFFDGTYAEVGPIPHLETQPLVGHFWMGFDYGDIN